MARSISYAQTEDQEVFDVGHVEYNVRGRLSQSLNEAMFFFIHRWRGTLQASDVGDNGQVWGKYSMVDVVGDGHAEYPVDFTAYHLWKGFEPQFTRWNNLGGPLLEQCCNAAQGDSLGRLSGGHFDGEMVLYAPNSTDDPTYDPMVQPHTIGFLDNDEKLNALGAAHREYYEDGILTRERQTHTPSLSPSRTWPHTPIALNLRTTFRRKRP